MLECDLWQSLAPSWGWGGREDGGVRAASQLCIYVQPWAGPSRYQPGKEGPDQGRDVQDSSVTGILTQVCLLEDQSSFSGLPGKDEGSVYKLPVWP